MRRLRIGSAAAAAKFSPVAGNEWRSRSSGPAMTDSINAASATVRVIGPACDSVSAALAGEYGTRPNEGFKPTIPQKLAGMRIEPAPSVPRESGPMPAATAAAEPPLDPPGVLVVSHGLRVGPKTGLSVAPFQPNSGVLVLPSMIAPARCRRST